MLMGYNDNIYITMYYTSLTVNTELNVINYILDINMK